MGNRSLVLDFEYPDYICMTHWQHVFSRSNFHVLLGVSLARDCDNYRVKLTAKTWKFLSEKEEVKSKSILFFTVFAAQMRRRFDSEMNWVRWVSVFRLACVYFKQFAMVFVTIEKVKKRVGQQQKVWLFVFRSEKRRETKEQLLANNQANRVVFCFPK